MMTKKSWFTSWQEQMHMLKGAAGLQTSLPHQNKKKNWHIIPCDLNWIVEYVVIFIGVEMQLQTVLCYSCIYDMIFII